MKWYNNYKLILFDFDGLLVNTEELHYAAYQTMLRNRGFPFPWDFPRYCQAAHYEATALRDQLYQEFPALYALEPNWDVLYKEKKEAYSSLINSDAIQMMPGVEEMLTELADNDVTSCVVTHSIHEHITLIREKSPILNTIPLWITREHYTTPKPCSECYLKAIELYAKDGDAIIGFEDSPRGIRALLGTRAQPVILSTIPYPEIEEFSSLGVWHFTDFIHFSQNAPRYVPK